MDRRYLDSGSPRPSWLLGGVHEEVGPALQIALGVGSPGAEVLQGWLRMQQTRDQEYHHEGSEIESPVCHS